MNVYQKLSELKKSELDVTPILLQIDAMYTKLHQIRQAIDKTTPRYVTTNDFYIYQKYFW